MKTKLKVVLLVAMILALIFCAGVAGASPFLACDVPTPADLANLKAGEVAFTVGGVTTTSPSLLQVQGTDYLLLDLSGKAGGRYTFKARFQDKSGWWGEWSDPLDAGKPAKGGAVRIIP